MQTDMHGRIRYTNRFWDEDYMSALGNFDVWMGKVGSDCFLRFLGCADDVSSAFDVLSAFQKRFDVGDRFYIVPHGLRFFSEFYQTGVLYGVVEKLLFGKRFRLLSFEEEFSRKEVSP